MSAPGSLRVGVQLADSTLRAQVSGWMREIRLCGRSVVCEPVGVEADFDALVVDDLRHPALASGTPSVCLHNGSARGVELSGAPLRLLEPRVLSAETLRLALEGVVELALERARTAAAWAAMDAQLRRLMDQQHEGVLIVDGSGRVAYSNEAACTLLGRAPAALLGRRPDIELSAGQCREIELMPAPGRLYTCEVRVLDTLWDGRAARLVLLRDVSQRRQAVRAMHQRQERYALAVAGASDGLWDWDILGGSVYFSPRFEAILGFDEGELPRSRAAYEQRVHPDDRIALRAALDAHLRGRTEHFESEHRALHRRGEYRWVLLRGLAVRNEENTAVRMAGSLSDTDERKRMEERLAHQAFHDTLTGLPNRALFMEQLARTLRQNRRRDGLVAVLFLDMDRFKFINDTLGHQAGDEFLSEIARRLAACVRPGDVVARLGGDEFTVLLDDIGGLEDARQVAERIYSALSEPYSLGDQRVRSSCSIGIALSDLSAGDADTLLRDADSAMYHAKASGRGRYVVFDANMRHRYLRRLRIESDLRRAVEQDELSMEYQPIVNAADEQLAGFEALVRWSHPEAGLLQPADFIPIAEETGLIRELSHWVLNAVCTQLGQWQAEGAGELFVNVNLSAKDFLRPDVAAEIEGILKGSGAEPRGLVLELTETALVDGFEQATRNSALLRDLGLRLCLDDFGTGYSSLAHLHRLPVDTVKIDSSFISGVSGLEQQPAVARSIIALAHAMQMKVIAEGVETDAQRRSLLTLNCDQAQGRYWSPPLEAGTAGDLLRQAIDGARPPTLRREPPPSQPRFPPAHRAARQTPE